MGRSSINSANGRKIDKVFTGLGLIPYKDLPGPIGDYCEDLADRVRAEAPVDTGELRDSVEVERPGEFNRFSGSDNLTWSVVVNSDHAAAVEYGKVGQAPNPFFRRAIGNSKAKLKAFVHEAIKRGVNRAGKG